MRHRSRIPSIVGQLTATAATVLALAIAGCAAPSGTADAPSLGPVGPALTPATTLPDPSSPAAGPASTLDVDQPAHEQPVPVPTELPTPLAPDPATTPPGSHIPIPAFEMPADAHTYSTFVAGDGLFHCDLWAGFARCSIAEHDYDFPPAPPENEALWGGGMQVDDEMGVGVLNRGDPLRSELDPDTPVLADGAVTYAGSYACRPDPGQVMCMELHTERGFILADTGFWSFGPPWPQ